MFHAVAFIVRFCIYGSVSRIKINKNKHQNENYII